MTGLPRPRIGSLFSGYGGLCSLGLAEYIGGEVVWHSEYEPPSKKVPKPTQGAARILAHNFPGVPNHGDITTVDWTLVEPVDWLAGGFPCFPAGTLITTSTGLVPIEAVRVGDRVLTHERRWKPVVQEMSRQADHRVTVKAMGAPTIATTDEHPFYVRQTRTSDAEWINASDLAVGMYLAQPMDECGDIESTAHAVATAYLVGRWLGDGWTVTHPRTSKFKIGQRGSRVDSVARRVHWCCAPKETDELEAAFFAAGIEPTRDDAPTAVKYVMQSVEWADRLDEFGKYAHGKKIPESVHHLPVDLQSAILEGWLDSDGDVKSDGTINGTTTSRALAIGMARIARCVYGKAVSIHEVTPAATKAIEGRTVNQRPYWNVRISRGTNKIAFVSGGFAWVPVRSVERTVEQQQVFNIGVQDDQSYVADSVVVHNCQDVSVGGLRKGLRPDTRSGLWTQFAYAIQILRPKYVLIENVGGIKSAKAHSELEPCLGCLGDPRGDAKPALRALGAVLGDLAGLGYTAVWGSVRADEAGAAHRRERVFILGARADVRADGTPPADTGFVLSEQGGGQPSDKRRAGGHSVSLQDVVAHDLDVVADTERGGRGPGAGLCEGDPGRVGWGRFGDDPGEAERRGDELDVGVTEGGSREGLRDLRGSVGPQAIRETVGGPGGLPTQEALQPLLRELTARVDGAGNDALAGTEVSGSGVRGLWDDGSTACPPQGPEHREQRPDESDDSLRLRSPEVALAGGPGEAACGCAPFGPYREAIHRWEHVMGTPAPCPTQSGPRGGHRLSPVFTEWLMGVPAGHVTDVPGLTRNEQLRALGNGVCPQQVRLALSLLLPMLEAEAA